MIMATREESLAGTEMSEEELKELFTSEFLQAAAASSTDHNVNYFYSEMAGVPSIVYGCRQEIDGAENIQDRLHHEDRRTRTGRNRIEGAASRGNRFHGKNAEGHDT